MTVNTETIELPVPVSSGQFVPVAYYDQHLDRIRVLTHDRSVTELRLEDGTFILHECNHQTTTDPEFVGFSIQGVRRLFAEVGLSIDGAYKLADVLDAIVKHRPGSTVATMARLVKTRLLPEANNYRLNMEEAVQQAV